MFNGAPYCGDTGAVPGDPRQPAVRGPAAVAVHDDGDVEAGLVVVFHLCVSSRRHECETSSTTGSVWLVLAESRTNQWSA